MLQFTENYTSANHFVLGILTFADGHIELMETTKTPMIDQHGNLLGVLGIAHDITQRKRAIAALHESEERLRLAISAANQGLYDLDIETGEAIVSPEYARMIGYEPEEFHETHEFWGSRLHPEDQDTTLQTFRDYLSGKLPGYRVEFRQKTKQGDWKWTMSLGKIQQLSADGRPLRMLGTHTDISARKEAEMALLKSEKEYRLLFETMSQGVIYQQANGQITKVNRAACEILGVEESEILKRKSSDDRWRALTADEKPFAGDLHPAMVALRTGKPVSNVVMGVYNPAKQCYVWILISATPEFKPGEAVPFQVFTTFTDITALRNSEKQLRFNEERLDQLARHSRNFAWEVDAEGKYTYISPVVEAVLGYTPEEFVGKKYFYDLHPEEDKEEFRKAGLAAFHRKEEFIQFENRALSKDGRLVWLSTNGIPLFNPDGTLSGYRGSDTDIALRKFAEEALRESESRYRGIFEVAPVGIAILQDEKLAFVNPTGHRMLGCTSGGECSGQLARKFINPEHLSTFNTLVDRLRNGEKGIFPVELELLTLSGTPLEVEITASILRYNHKPAIQIIATDITERVKYMRAMEAQNKILKDIAWTQSHVVRAPLATMMGLINLLELDDFSDFSHQDILAQINNKAHELDQVNRNISDKTYTVSIIEQEKEHKPALLEHHHTQRQELLLVDDDQLVQKLHTSVAVKSNFHPGPRSFFNGKTALEFILTNNHPESLYLVWLDINMPVMNGWAFLDALNEHELLCKVQVIILTSSVDMADRIRAQKYPQVIDYLTKPLNRQTVQNLLSHPKLKGIWK